MEIPLDASPGGVCGAQTLNVVRRSNPTRVIGAVSGYK